MARFDRRQLIRNRDRERERKRNEFEFPFLPIPMICSLHVGQPMFDVRETIEIEITNIVSFLPSGCFESSLEAEKFNRTPPVRVGMNGSPQGIALNSRS